MCVFVVQVKKRAEDICYENILLNLILRCCSLVQLSFTVKKARNNGSGSLQVGDAVAIIKGEKKNLRRKEKRARIEQIRANLGLSDAQRTPTVLAVFLFFFFCPLLFFI